MEVKGCSPGFMRCLRQICLLLNSPQVENQAERIAAGLFWCLSLSSLCYRPVFSNKFSLPLPVTEKLLQSVLDPCEPSISLTHTISASVPVFAEQLSCAEQNPGRCPGGSEARHRLRGPGSGPHRGRIRRLQQGYAFPNTYGWWVGGWFVLVCVWVGGQKQEHRSDGEILENKKECKFGCETN